MFYEVVFSILFSFFKSQRDISLNFDPQTPFPCSLDNIILTHDYILYWLDSGAWYCLESRYMYFLMKP